jgi:hypothetical protein
MAEIVESITTPTSRAVETIIPDSEPLRNGLAFIYGCSVGALLEVPFQWLNGKALGIKMPHLITRGLVAVAEGASAMMVYDILEVNMGSSNDSLFLMGLLVSLPTVRAFGAEITATILGEL